MSCGNPHEIPCSEVLDQVYLYLDNEMPDEADTARIKEHLDECGPCLDSYGLENAVKLLVHRSCGCDAVPSDLRDKVMARIRAVRGELDTR